MPADSTTPDLASLAARLHLKNPSALSPALAAALGTVAPETAQPAHTGALALDAVSFRIVDIEATGLSVVHDEMIDVCVYELKNGALTRLIDTAVRPRQTVTPRIYELTGLSPDLLEAAPPLEAIATDLLNALSGDCLVAHNAQADVGYLSQLVLRFDPHWICPPVACTLKLSRQLLAEQAAAFGLLALSEQLHLPLPTHRAASDALCTARLLELLVDKARAKGAATLDDLVNLSQRKPKQRPAPQISPLVVDALPDGPGVYRFFGEGDRLLYVGQSSSIRRRVKDHLYRAGAGASLEILRRAVRVEAEPLQNELEAFVREGEAIACERPLLNTRSSEHGRVRFLRVSQGGAVTLAAIPSPEAGVRSFGPLVLARSERVVLRALRDTFGLSAREPKQPHPDAATRFAHFAAAPLDDKPASADQATWEVLLDLKRSLHRAEAERLDAQRPFRHPTVVASARNAGALYAIAVGRPTLRLDPRAASLGPAVYAWLAAPPQGSDLDDAARRISAYVRAHPQRVTLTPAAEVAHG